MKKPYIQPDAHEVVINLMGSVLDQEEVGIAGSRAGATFLESREMKDDRFEGTDETWDWE
jgi:hypothetical protein